MNLHIKNNFKIVCINYKSKLLIKFNNNLKTKFNLLFIMSQTEIMVISNIY